MSAGDARPADRTRRALAWVGVVLLVLLAVRAAVVAVTAVADEKYDLAGVGAAAFLGFALFAASMVVLLRRNG
jgi:hypothetical protein